MNNTQRDEWARIIVGELHPGPQDDPMTWPAQVWRLADAIVERIKPRTITTVEELDALPSGSVVLDGRGISLHKNGFTGWVASNGAKRISREMLEAEALPATVLHEPEAIYHSEDCGGACDGCGFIAPNGGWYPGPCPPEYATQQLEWSESGVPEAEATR